MTDVAVLGLQVDSRPVAAAKTELTGLASAAKGAETATGALEAAAKRAGVSVQEMQGRVDKARSGLNPMAQAADVAAKSHNRLSFEARNLSYQLVDVTQGVLMGQSAFQIMAQQGGQLAQVIATSPGGLGGLMRELGRGIAGMLTPMRLLGAATIGVGVAGYAFYSSWKTAALQLDDTARAIGTTIGQLRGLQSAAEIKGIEDFSKDAEKFAGFIYQARNNMGSLGDVLRANGERASDFAGTLEAAARIIGRARSDQERLQLLQQMGLPATMQWVRFLSQGGDAIRRAVEDGNSLNQNEQILIDKAREFDEAWSRAWREFKRSARDASLEALSWLDQAAQKARGAIIAINQATGGTAFQVGKGVLANSMNGVAGMSGTTMDASDANDFYARFGKTFGASGQTGGKQGPAVNPEVAKANLQRQIAYLSALGQTASVAQQVRLAELQLQQQRANGVRVDDTTIAKAAELARQRALGTDQIRAQTDAYNIDAATVGMSIEKAATYAAVQERLNEARRNGQVLTAANIAEIEREAAAMGAAAARADNLRFAYDTFSGTMREFGSNIRNGQNALTALGNAGANALGKIADRLMDMASRNLWNAAFGGSGGGSGIFGSLFSGIFGGSGGGGGTGFSLTTTGGLFANGGAFPAGSLSAFSNSVVTKPTVFPINDGPIRAFAKGAGLMGEAGPEAIMPLTRGADGKLGVRAAGAGGGVTINNTYTFNGVEPGMEARLRNYIDQGDRRSVQQASQAVQAANATSGGKFLGRVR